VDAYNALSTQITDAVNRLDADAYTYLAEQQNKLLVWQPWITHSITETTARFAFHVQMIADFSTVEELGEKMLSELQLAKATPSPPQSP